MARDKVTQIIVDRLVKMIETTERLPWREPWHFRYAFNWYSMHVYTGINRWLLPAGEYMTKNQLNEYNTKHGTNFKFTKGIEWLPVVFMKPYVTPLKRDDIPDDVYKKLTANNKATARSNGLTYKYDKDKGCICRVTLIRRYYLVADIKWFKDENGNTLPSKIETGEVNFYFEEPEEVIQYYLDSSGVMLDHNVHNEAYYLPQFDSVHVPSKGEFKTKENYYSTLFHELAHSTGHSIRLAREAIVDTANYRHDKGCRSKEELIAEMTSCLLCSETGIFDIDDTDNTVIANSTGYVQAWAKYLKDTKDDIIYIASASEKAKDLILHGVKGFAEDDEGSEVME